MTHQCEADAAFRYTWPGRDESFVCQAHASKLQDVAAALGLKLQVIPLSPGHRESCRQQVSGRDG